MSKQLTIDDARQSLIAHVAAKGAEIRDKYGPRIGWSQLEQILADRTCVRYPTAIAFDAGPLLNGEFAYASAKGECPEDGYIIYVHPYLATQPERVPAAVLYQLVVVNYGAFASANDAEAFGAAVLGIATQEYYDTLCRLAGEIEAAPGGVSDEGSCLSPACDNTKNDDS